MGTVKEFLPVRDRKLDMKTQRSPLSSVCVCVCVRACVRDCVFKDLVKVRMVRARRAVGTEKVG